MELTRNEVTFLYQIMEVKKIVGFDLFALLEEKETEEVLETLRAKKWMLNNTLTEYGLTMLDILSLYVKTKVYYKFGKDTVFANYADTEYIMFRKTKEGFRIELLTQEALIASILAKFKDWNSLQEGEIKKRCLSKQKFSEQMSEKEEAEAIFYYKMDLEAQKDRKSVIFIAEGYFQHYNASSGELDMYPRKEVQKGIESIFVREE